MPPQQQMQPPLPPIVPPSRESFHEQVPSQSPSQFQRDTPPFSPDSMSPSNSYADPPRQQGPSPSYAGAPPSLGPPSHTYDQPSYQQPHDQPDPPYHQPAYEEPPHEQPPSYTQAPRNGPTPPATSSTGASPTSPAPARAVFGVSLDDLFARDGAAVPLVIQQCLQAVEMFGMEIEGIYRLSGSAAHIAKLREAFNHGQSRSRFLMPRPFLRWYQGDGS